MNLMEVEMRSMKVYFLVLLIVALSRVCLFAGSYPESGNTISAPPLDPAKSVQAAPASQSDPAIAITPLGKVKGKPCGDVVSWLGVRYAEPPVGKLRFKAPVPGAALGGRLRCDEIRVRCSAASSFVNGVHGKGREEIRRLPVPQYMGEKRCNEQACHGVVSRRCLHVR